MVHLYSGIYKAVEKNEVDVHVDMEMSKNQIVE